MHEQRVEGDQARRTRTLFVSYDGLTDPLGESQIFPYISGIEESGCHVLIVSFEKQNRFLERGTRIRELIQGRSITWCPLRFSSFKPKILAKIWDLLQMYTSCFYLASKHKARLVHCRSYNAAQVGLWLKKILGLKYLFDIRGLWIDERVDGGIWDLNRLSDKAMYTVYRAGEGRLYKHADHIVSLTSKALPIVEELSRPITVSTSVIPCCADYSFFCASSADDVAKMKLDLGFPQDSKIVTYIGSLGTWYLVEDMFRCFEYLSREREDLCMLILTRDWDEKAEVLWEKVGLSTKRDRLKVLSVGREDVPSHLSISDATLSFIKPAYSKIASSPTKIAESLALGIPVICNPIGDLGEKITDLAAGWVLQGFEEADFAKMDKEFDEILALKGQGVRVRSQKRLDLKVAQSQYAEIYRRLGVIGSDSLER